MEEKEQLKFYISEIAKLMGLAQPVGFMLSYEVGDIWIDVYVERGEDEWQNRTYTISVPKNKGDKLRNFVEAAGGNTSDMMADAERVYASLTQEDWEQVSTSIMNLL
ncbi:MAG: hypothetical protein KNN13_01850 [Hydrogenobacter thermophilus]|uniref:hypothetical protein n=1 Tax=Hydrogenobacter thermophilus TaxID=940 RepID=UPI000CBAEC65|nr:hypothetical protein [Hydrogenobacter thermophilus]QWK20097.1 MAG: hypothetical protein KNN13_01850 [Hydrogenobacter thermophilus]GBC89226.1 hypothetical protein HRbin13_01366 [bacterium HR13]